MKGGSFLLAGRSSQLALPLCHSLVLYLFIAAFFNHSGKVCCAGAESVSVALFNGLALGLLYTATNKSW
jgi:hypothetical protein